MILLSDVGLFLSKTFSMWHGSRKRPNTSSFQGDSGGFLPAKAPKVEQGQSYTLYMIGGCSSLGVKEAEHSFQCYDFDNETWTSAAQRMPCERSAFAVASFQNRIWVVGGRDVTDTVLETVLVYDPSSSQWTYSRAMNAARRSLCAAVVGGNLYALGGSDNSKVLRSVETWNGYNWADCAPMTFGRWNFAVGVLRNRLYAVGGYGESLPLHCVEYYTPHDNIWIIVRPPAVQRINCGIGVVNDKLYCLGGDGDGTVSYCYDSGSGDHVWMNSIATVPDGLMGFDVVADCRNLYLVGGICEESSVPSLQCFNPVNLAWSVLPRPSGLPRYGVKAVIAEKSVSSSCPS